LCWQPLFTHGREFPADSSTALGGTSNRIGCSRGSTRVQETGRGSQVRQMMNQFIKGTLNTMTRFRCRDLAQFGTWTRIRIRMEERDQFIRHPFYSRP
jgi:hypothetical protein